FPGPRAALAAETVWLASLTGLGTSVTAKLALAAQDWRGPNRLDPFLVDLLYLLPAGRRFAIFDLRFSIAAIANRESKIQGGPRMASKTAPITGITGQDGSYLAELLLEKGYRVCGMVRRSSTDHFQRLEHIRDCVQVFQGDLLDYTSIATILDQVRPD